jgi:hypothetical protein
MQVVACRNLSPETCIYTTIDLSTSLLHAHSFEAAFFFSSPRSPS